jgi:hypothetical protein
MSDKNLVIIMNMYEKQIWLCLTKRKKGRKNLKNVANLSLKK